LRADAGLRCGHLGAWSLVAWSRAVFTFLPYTLVLLGRPVPARKTTEIRDPECPPSESSQRQSLLRPRRPTHIHHTDMSPKRSHLVPCPEPRAPRVTAPPSQERAPHLPLLWCAWQVCCLMLPAFRCRALPACSPREPDRCCPCKLTRSASCPTPPYLWYTESDHDLCALRRRRAHQCYDGGDSDGLHRRTRRRGEPA
jgi:hypothetical protein